MFVRYVCKAEQRDQAPGERARQGAGAGQDHAEEDQGKSPVVITLNSRFEKTAKTTLRQHFFSNRIIDQWNKLPNSMKDASSVISFKNMHDKTYLIY